MCIHVLRSEWGWSLQFSRRYKIEILGIIKEWRSLVQSFSETCVDFDAAHLAVNLHGLEICYTGEPCLYEI